MTNVETVIEEVRRGWSDLLNVPTEDVALQSDFFVDGGDSLTAVELVVALGDRFDIDVPMDPIFVEGTVGALVECICTALDLA